MIARCSSRRVQIHETRDSVPVSDAAAAAMRSALFAPGHRAACRCSLGECKQSECDALKVFDADGKHIATYHGKDWRAVDGEIGPVKGLVIFRQPASAQTQTQDSDSLQYLTGDEQKAGLKKLNEANADFWRPKEGSWLHQQQSK